MWGCSQSDCRVLQISQFHSSALWYTPNPDPPRYLCQTPASWWGLQWPLGKSRREGSWEPMLERRGGGRKQDHIWAEASSPLKCSVVPSVFSYKTQLQIPNYKGLQDGECRAFNLNHGAPFWAGILWVCTSYTQDSLSSSFSGKSTPWASMFNSNNVSNLLYLLWIITHSKCLMCRLAEQLLQLDFLSLNPKSVSC